MCRDALAKSIFAALFDWVVAQVNATSRASGGALQHTIGILDIFGFEQLKHNSFEQLLINFVNEMLQEQFNESVFAAERRLFAAEGVEVEDGTLTSSADRLHLMTRLLQGLDDQCRLGDRGSDEEFFQEIGMKHTVRGVCQAEQRGVFSINHYAGKVCYSTDGFVQKNSDQLPADVTALFGTCEALASIRSNLLGGAFEAGPRARSASVASSILDVSSARASLARPEGGTTLPPGFKLNLSLANARVSAAQAQEAVRHGGAQGAALASHRRGPSDDMATPRTGRRSSTKSTTLSERLRAGIGQVPGSDARATEGLMATLQVRAHHACLVLPSPAPHPKRARPSDLPEPAPLLTPLYRISRLAVASSLLSHRQLRLPALRFTPCRRSASHPHAPLRSDDLPLNAHSPPAPFAPATAPRTRTDSPPLPSPCRSPPFTT